MKNLTRKSEKNEDGSGGSQESQSISTVDATEHVPASVKDGIAGTKNDLKMNRAKKFEKSKGGESGINNGSKEGELVVAYGDGHSGNPIDNAEEKKRKTRKRISKTKNTEDDSKERNKKHKVKRKLKDLDSEKEGEIDEKEMKGERTKRKIEKRKSKGDSSMLQQENILEYNVVGNFGLAEHDGNDGKKLERKKKKMKKNKKKYNNDNGLVHHIDEMQIDEVEYAKKHTQFIESGSDDLLDNGVESDEKGKIQKAKPVENSSDEKENVGGDDLIRGKRFSPEEDETVKAAVLHYIEKNDLGDKGLDMVLNCSKYPEVKGCWKEICTAIPYRPRRAVYMRAQILFHRSEFRKWTQEEYALLHSYHKEHGNKWKAIATELGKHPTHVRNAWCTIKANYNTGQWSQDEYQKLFNLVNLDLQAKLSEEKISKHGMLRDNICWTAISEVLSTRSQPRCCEKWYRQLTSRMVSDGVWADLDDYRLIHALYGLDATCLEDVDWDVLLDNRDRDVCRKRWDQMVLHIGHHSNKSFSEQVEVLAQRYCPILLEAREIWDSKPRVG